MTTNAIRWLAALLLTAFGLLNAALAQTQGETDAGAALQGEIEYTVVPGDTLIGIARRLLKDGDQAGAYRRIATHNKLKNPDSVSPGTVLRIPLPWVKGDSTIGARVIAATGRVQSGARVLRVGDQLAEGETVETGADGYLTLQFADQSTVLIKAESNVRIEAHRKLPTLEEFEARLRLNAGAIEAKISKQRTPRFGVTTPAGQLAVRGTEFRTRGSAASMLIEVLDGLVAAAGQVGEPVVIEPGFGTVVRAGEAARRPVRLLAAPDVSGVGPIQDRTVVRLQFGAVGGAIAYRFRTATDALFRNTLVETEQRVTEVRIIDLPDGDYHIGVRGVDNNGLEGREATARFTLKARPVAPTTLAPLEESTLTGTTASFVWDPEREATSYRFQLSTDPNFDTLVVDRSNIAQTETSVDMLKPGKYYWRVASIRATGEQGPYGEILSFTVRSAPPVQPPARQP